MDRIVAWGATDLVCLMEFHEFEELGVGNLPEVTSAAGLTFHHLPIRDQGVPDDRFEISWVDEGPQLRASLQAGGKIVIHCKGGLGRTGTIAARLLIEMGLDAGVAMRRVRAARPGAIENRVQEDYVLALLPIRSPNLE